MLCLLFLLLSEVNVYFNKSVDTTYNNGFPSANGKSALDSLLICRISRAKYSIDFCFYNIGRENIVDSLIAAHKKGMKIRVITDNGNDTNACEVLRDSGIIVINDRRSSYMHNKFAVFDARDSSLAESAWVWTGSYNITDACTESNSNDVIEIQNKELARAYTVEFEEMWGDTGDVSPDTGHFGTAKWSDPTHHFNINSEEWGLYFSPSESLQIAMFNAVKTANYSIYCSIFSFTFQLLCDTIKEKWETKGVMVKGVFDAVQAGSKYSKYKDMRGDSAWVGDSLINNPWLIPAPVYIDSVNKWGFLHDKYMIIDADYPESDPIVITGSQNWSISGYRHNDENTLTIHSPWIANQYLQHFMARYKEAGGESIEEKLQPIENRVELKIYPNPFTSVTSVKWSGVSEGQKISVQIYDLSGRLVKTLVTNHLSLTTAVEWDGRDKDGKLLPHGIYFVSLTAGKVKKSYKIVFLK